MRFKIPTKVEQDYQKVFAGFTEELFLKLKPPGMKLDLLRYDGMEKGDVVHVRVGFIFFSQDWISLITDRQDSEDELYFIDEGEKLPFFLKAWKHRHRILKDGEGAKIIDDIEYKTPFLLLDYLMYPIMYAQFAWRKPIYRKVFKLN